MQKDLLQARQKLCNKLYENAEKVKGEVLNINLENLVEIGIFGSLAKDKFTCKSDSDIYLLFDNDIPDRQIKGVLRSIAEENNCDIVFISKKDIETDELGLLAKEILKDRIIMWRMEEYDTK